MPGPAGPHMVAHGGVSAANMQPQMAFIQHQSKSLVATVSNRS